MNQLLRVQNFNVSRDGFGAGEHQSIERPFGHANPGDMFAWAGATASWPMRTDRGGSRGLDDYFTRDYARNIGAEIMGRNKFGPQRGPWHDHDWRGWWGDEPPFHTPVFVLTPPSGNFSAPASSTPCTWRSRRWNSDPGRDSGNHPMSCLTSSTSRSCPAPAA